MEDSSNSSNGSNGSNGSQTKESKATSSSDKSTTSSNTSVDSQTKESTTNSNGNFSGGIDSSALSNDSFNPDSTPDFGIDFGDSKDNKDNSFGFGENLFSDFDFGDFSDSGSGEPTMTVDEVYGKSTETGVLGNQSIVETQGDYAATSNEKSNVGTSTLGKQDNISVTPTEVTENKGTVTNDTIQSVEGLDFQQKDKESQDVLEAKKNRDEAEAEDKAKTDLAADEKEAINKFQIGNDDIENIYAKVSEEKARDLQSKSEALTQKTNDVKDAEAKRSAAEAEQNKLLGEYKNIQDRAAQAKTLTDNLEANMNEIQKNNPMTKAVFERSKHFKDLKAVHAKLAKTYGIDIGDVSGLGIDEMAAINSKLRTDILERFSSETEEVSKELQYANKVKDDAELAYNNALKAQGAAKDDYDNASREYNNLAAAKDALRDEVNQVKDSYEKGEMSASEAVNRLQDMSLKSPFGLKTADMVYLAGGLDGKYLADNPSALQGRYVGANPDDPDIKAFEDGLNEYNENLKDAIAKINNADLSDEIKSKANGLLNGIAAARDEVKTAANALAANPDDPDDIKTYVDAVNKYNENIKNALAGNPLTKTDLNKTFTRNIANANDFKVTLPDGRTVDYTKFAAEKAVESPKIAKALYEKKAQKYEADNHPILAKIERLKAKKVETWLGSKFTLADNQVRKQFNQMAKTNMRATYATYNNVLNDKTGKYSEDEKAEASAALNQANSLMTASAALKASTGFLSGIGDSMSDGVYGVTDPDTLNGYQKTLNTAGNFVKTALFLGVTSGSKEAYQNMYYMAGAKVNESRLLSKDFDGDGFALCQEYGNSAAVSMIVGAGELAIGVAMLFNLVTAGIGLKLVIDSIQTFINGLYGVQKDARKSLQYNREVLGYFKDAKDIAAETGNKEAYDSISAGITQIENFQLKSGEVGNLDNWLEGSGSNTADNGKFNQSLSYDEWLKLIEADPTMQEYAKTLTAEKKNK